MKLSEFIKKLQFLQNNVGDTDLNFTVQDQYSRIKHDITIDLKTGDTTGFPSDFNGTYTADGRTRIEFSIYGTDKKAKIYYIK